MEDVRVCLPVGTLTPLTGQNGALSVGCSLYWLSRSSPAVAGEAVIFAVRPGCIVALHRQTRVHRWAYTTTAWIVAAMAYASERVIVASQGIPTREHAWWVDLCLSSLIYVSAYGIVGEMLSDARRTVMMDITIQVPEDIAIRWQVHGNVSRDVLAGAALEAYRKRIIGEARLQQWLGFETRFEVHAFLKEHGVPVNYTLEDLERDRHTHDRLGV